MRYQFQFHAVGCSTTVAAPIDKRAPGYEQKFVLKQQVMTVALRPKEPEL